MSLSCECGDDYETYYSRPNSYTTLQTNRRKRCVSCKKLIDINSVCVKFPSYRSPRDDIEENIYGDEVPIASPYMCEECGDLYFSLTELGFCINLGDGMRDLVWEYNDFYMEKK